MQSNICQSKKRARSKGDWTVFISGIEARFGRELPYCSPRMEGCSVRVLVNPDRISFYYRQSSSKRDLKKTVRLTRACPTHCSVALLLDQRAAMKALVQNKFSEKGHAR